MKSLSSQSIDLAFADHMKYPIFALLTSRYLEPVTSSVIHRHLQNVAFTSAQAVGSRCEILSFCAHMFPTILDSN